MVPIARREEEWRHEPGQDLAQMRIFVRRSVMNAVAGVDDRVDALAIDIGDAAPQIVRARCGRRIGGILSQNMRVADLSEDHAAPRGQRRLS
jgi:hypothetical protein